MPELPEVEIIRQGLEKYLPGKKIQLIEVRIPKLFVGTERVIGETGDLTGAKITSVRRRAKVLLLDLTNDKTLLIHLKMTGQLVFQSADEKEKVIGGHPQEAYNQPLPHKHTHIIFYFTDGSKLYFNDLRKFGWIHVVPTKKADSYGMLSTVGPEPLSQNFTETVLRERLMQFPNRLIFVALLDQSLIAGLGNIYVNESLYESKIYSERKVSSLTPKDWHMLWKAIKNVLSASISYGGTSDSTYINVDGKRGNYLAHAHVYHRKIAQPCGHAIVTKKIGGRTAHFCPVDQA